MDENAYLHECIISIRHPYISVPGPRLALVSLAPRNKAASPPN